jgi:two-component system, chemotaxis family, sensor kinase CheA
MNESASCTAGSASRHALLEAATLQLVTAAPGDASRLTAVLQAIAPLVHDDDALPWVRQALATAVELLEAALAGDLDHDSAITRAGALIEMVMHDAPGPAAENDTAADGFVLPAEVIDELLPDFLAESLEHLEQVERALLQLDAQPADSEAINVVFRAFHTIKSTSAFLGLQPIATLAHAAESMLCELRDGTAAATPAHADLVLQCVDVTRDLLARTRAGTPLTLVPDAAELLDRLQRGAVCVADAPLAAGDPTVEAARRAASRVTMMPQAQAAAPSQDGRQRGETTSVRVRTDRLDRLIGLLGELVVAHSMVAQDALLHEHRHDALAGKVAHSGKIVRDLQELGMSLRMVPLRPLFQKMERLVRDLGRAAGKRVDFVMEGASTEIDRQMVDLLADPLVHMIRNAMDHAFEAPEERAATGKPAAGTLRLSAWHAGGDVVIELQDDGRGLDAARIFDRAVERGIIDGDRTLPTGEIWNLIFAPGLSTAGSVTALSGRGVGMDVVRRNIEALRGRIEIASVPGASTTFRIRLPLTLAVTEGMLVRLGGERYIVPTAEIQTCFRPAADALITVAGAGELVTWHDQIMPIVRLHDLLGVQGAVTRPVLGVLVVVGSGPHPCALLVDELLGRQQFVVRPVDEGLGHVQGLGGTAILGDGRVGLILDVPGIIASR